VVAAPLKTDGDFTSPQTEVWANEMVTEPVARSWGEEVPVSAPVVGGSAQAVSYSSEDWASQVSTSLDVLENCMFSCAINVYWWWERFVASNRSRVVL
jgi:hypothetical protein